MTSKEKLISSPVFYLSQGVGGRFLARGDGNIELAIIINDNTTAEELRKAWTAIDKARTELRDIQGSDMDNPDNALMYSYTDMKEKGWSYCAIAKDINYDCLFNICNAVEYVPDLEKRMINMMAFSKAFQLLKLMQMKDKDILNYLIPALEDIYEERAPWNLDTGPVDGSRVRDALRHWRRKQQTKKVVIKAPPKCNEIAIEELEKVVKKIPNKADFLLERTYPGSLRRHIDYIKKTFLKYGYSGILFYDILQSMTSDMYDVPLGKKQMADMKKRCYDWYSKQRSFDVGALAFGRLIL